MLNASNGDWQTGFRCKYKCHRNYSAEKSANKQQEGVHSCMAMRAWEDVCSEISEQSILSAAVRFTFSQRHLHLKEKKKIQISITIWSVTKFHQMLSFSTIPVQDCPGPASASGFIFSFEQLPADWHQSCIISRRRWLTTTTTVNTAFPLTCRKKINFIANVHFSLLSLKLCSIGFVSKQQLNMNMHVLWSVAAAVHCCLDLV